MSLNLCIDWGNSQVKVAIFDNDTIQKQFAFPEESALEKVSSLIDAHSPVKAKLLCSLLFIHDDELTHLLKSKIKSFLKLDSFTRLPVNNAYMSPETLGPDRLALVCGAFALYPGKNNLAISLGTCITYNLLQKNRTFTRWFLFPG